MFLFCFRMCVYMYLHSGTSGRPIWKVYLDPIEAGGPYNITASSGDCQITLSDVLFGDVWFCSGQSNMAYFMNIVSSNPESAISEKMYMYT